MNNELWKRPLKEIEEYQALQEEIVQLNRKIVVLQRENEELKKQVKNGISIRHSNIKDSGI